VNVWLALTFPYHVHHAEAKRWLDSVATDSRITFSRYTQLGLLRLLTTTTVMGADTVTLREAWDAFDFWLEDPRIELRPEPPSIDGALRQATAPHLIQPASTAVGDSCLLAFAKQSDAALPSLISRARTAATP
jgi:toxin-antitoxin system PIN domain toxin